jgi:hypothetical protein
MNGEAFAFYVWLVREIDAWKARTSPALVARFNPLAHGWACPFCRGEWDFRMGRR